MKKCLALFVLLAAAAFAGAPAYQFSADLVMTASGHSVTGKYYMDKDKVRMEMSMMGQTTTTIARHDKKVSWIIMENKKSYMEVSMDRKTQGPTPFDPNADFKYTAAGTETVDGHPCKKMKFTVVHNGATITGYHWLATDLHDMPIKWSDEAGTSVMEMRNIKLGPVPAEKFELPAGYTKMEMPMGHPPVGKETPQGHPPAGK
jgi:hypothetical protein